ncbi:hypothetical protein B0I35DRAFT_500067 [Stachybotrys elegans]|uniref:F-box domain-containing protein n=1 Tax=Stachybotrys elegans TaxID=80388 RepID=A0A8K0WTA1_9HYPO|nr:hypothetical protein B0I35DRAFT_500067 [Stachybotrys elegans]
MGYSEVQCQLCGVSFNISRLRTADEPCTAAWSNTGDGATPFVTQEDALNHSRDGERCSAATACSTREHFLREYPASFIEHIAAPDCRCQKAYLGHNISAEAMRGCNTVQCLIRKPPNWTRERDDEDFELTARFFLSGISDHMPSRDMSCPTYFPVRHGVEEHTADNLVYEQDDQESAIPFHPACLEIFKRASLFRNRVVDLDGLEHWWFNLGLDKPWSFLGQDQAVRRSSTQWWVHHIGLEFLAANPCFVPGLDSILLSAQARTAVTGLGDSAMAMHDMPDIFSTLPLEIKLRILDFVRFEDVLSLRGASRQFWYLPSSFFYKSTIKDMPWLYEAWSSLPLSFWATKTATELKEENEHLQAQLAGPREALAVLEAEEVEEPGLHTEAKAALMGVITAHLEENEGLRGPQSAILLDRDKTDWFRLRLQLLGQHSKLLGLQNRERVWKLCMKILRVIDLQRKEGRIPPRES